MRGGRDLHWLRWNCLRGCGGLQRCLGLFDLRRLRYWLRWWSSESGMELIECFGF